MKAKELKIGDEFYVKTKTYTFKVYDIGEKYIWFIFTDSVVFNGKYEMDKEQEVTKL